MANQILSGLNQVQAEAVANIKGPNLIVAGAGSGKTRVLTYKIAYMVANGVAPYKILALTFTKKAANEMKERIAKLIGQENAAMLQMGTFHSIFAKLMRQDADRLGYSSNFTIYDTSDSKSLIRKIIKDLKLNRDYYKENEVYGRISKAKNNLITWQAYQSNTDLRSYDASSRKPDLYKVYAEYVKRCRLANAMDFDDLLLNMNILFKNFPDVLEKYQNRFDFILVDEYQDTNISQYLIIKKLSEKHRNITVVGDDAQSIYSFRGAEIKNILNFERDYPDLKVYKLEQNYRSTKNIVNAANSVIKKNTEQIPKNVFSEQDEGSKITVIRTNTDKDEAYTVVQKIFDLQYQNQYKYSDFAILYRTNMQSRLFEESLRKKNIPYKIYGGMSFYQRKEIKDLLSYLRLTINPNDTEALKRIINYPKRGIGATSIEKLETASAASGVGIWQILININKYNIGISPAVANKILKFVYLIAGFIEKNKELDAYQITSLIAKETGILQDLYKDKSPEGVSRHENIKEFINASKEFVEQIKSEQSEEQPTLESFVENISLLTDLDVTDKKDETPRVSLMTIHSAKGLEFKNVFIVGVEQDLFPSAMSSNTLKELNEERRLFYVALTRAEENAFISYAEARRKWGKFSLCNPSMFIKEIDSQYLEFEGLDYGFNFKQENEKPLFFEEPKKNINFKPKEKTSFNKFNKTKNSSFSNFKASDSNLIKIGDTVEHSRFGIGTVIDITGNGTEKKASVDFKMAGIKQLLLKFAKLKIIEN